ncbi:MAG: rod shape-determining protein MreD [Bacteroidota bacterium]|nr:rod shape-determining protein MreD [Bacteroidota bacterium]
MQRYVQYALITLALVILQATIIPFVSIANTVPDVLLVWIVYIAIQAGQIPATIAGFTAGIVVDLIGGQFIGLSAFSKTIAGFLAGYFYSDNKIEQTLGSHRFLLVVALASFIHNIVYFTIFVQGTSISFWTAVFQFGIFSTIYTTATALFPVFSFHRKLA